MVGVEAERQLTEIFSQCAAGRETSSSQDRTETQCTRDDGTSVSSRVDDSNEAEEQRERDEWTTARRAQKKRKNDGMEQHETNGRRMDKSGMEGRKEDRKHY